MTTFGDQLYHHGGVPVGGCSSPTIFPESNYYYVDQATGLSGNTGRSASAPLDTIAAAITLMKARINWSNSPWARNDVLFIGPGKYEENLTSLPYGCTMIGSGSHDKDGEVGTVIAPSTGAPVDASTAINIKIHDICFTSAGAYPTFSVDTLNNNLITNCQFRGDTSDDGTRLFETASSCVRNRISNCVFHRGAYGMYLKADGGGIWETIIEDCYITGCTAGGIWIDTGSVASFTAINNCIIGDGVTTLALGFFDDAESVQVTNTMFTAAACDPASGSGYYNHSYLNGSLMT